MRTEKITIFEFNELTEDAQQKAIDNLSDINVDFDWWDFTYNDAALIGLNITGFDIGKGSCVDGDMTESPEEVARLIMENHGPVCETYKDAINFLEEVKGWDDESQAFEEAALEFERTIKEDYRIILSNEYDFLTSEEAIKETIEVNEYEFTADGKIF